MTFDQLATQLNEHLIATGRVEFQGSGITPPSRPLKWSKFPKRYQEGLKRVPADFFPLYEQIQDMWAQWEYLDPTFAAAPICSRTFIGPITEMWTNSFDYIDGHQPLWDERLPAEAQRKYAEYFVFDQMEDRTYVLWSSGPERVELALYLGQDRLHPLPFTPEEYVRTGFAFGFMELWQLFFLPAGQQADYAAALGTLLAQVRHLFPAALPLLPPHVATQFAPPPPLLSPDYRQLLTALLAHLRSLPGLQLDVQFLRPGGAPLGTMERVRRELGFALDPEMQAFYTQLNGCLLTWTRPATATTPATAGRLGLWPIEEVVGGPDFMSRKFWPANIDDGWLWAAEHPAYVPGLAGLRAFDDLQEGGFASVRLSAQASELFYIGGDDLDYVEALRLSFAEYAQLALRGGAVQDWPLLYLAEHVDTGTEPAEAPQVRAGLQAIELAPEVLPHYREKR